MALPEDLDTLCTQQLFRAAESSHLEELNDFNLVLSQTSDAELSAFCTQDPALSLRDHDENPSRAPPTTSAAQLNPQGAPAPTGSQIQKQVEVEVFQVRGFCRSEQLLCTKSIEVWERHPRSMEPK